MKNTSRFLSTEQHYKHLQPFSLLDVKDKEDIGFNTNSFYGRASQGTERQAFCIQHLIWLLLAVISPRLLPHGAVKWHLPAPARPTTSSTGCTWAGYRWGWGDYLEAILLWACFIHVPFLRHWMPAQGFWSGKLLCWQLRTFWWGRIRPWHTISSARCQVILGPTAQTGGWSPKSPT